MFTSGSTVQQFFTAIAGNVLPATSPELCGGPVGGDTSGPGAIPHVHWTVPHLAPVLGVAQFEAIAANVNERAIRLLAARRWVHVTVNWPP